MKTLKCFKCGIDEGALIKYPNHGKEDYPAKIIKHHTSYNPSVVVDCCQSCHLKIHKTLRKYDMCPISVDDLHKLTQKLYEKRMLESKLLQTIYFYQPLGKGVRLQERIKYNYNTGNYCITSRYVANNNNHLYIIEESNEF